MTVPPRRPRVLRALLAVASVGLAAAGTGALAAGRPTEQPGTPALTTPFALVEDRDVDDRLAQPEDRYAVAGGCYRLEAPGQGWVARDGDGAGVVLTPDASTALPLHFQATRLGEYLLAANEGRDTRWEDAWWDVRSYLSASSPDPLGALPGDVALAPEPAEDTEWRLVASATDPDRKAAGQTYVLSVPSRGQALAVRDGDVALVDGTGGTPLALHHVPDDDPSDGDPNGAACATWPEIETGASGDPQPAPGSPAGRVRGFFEAHVHGMAFEFLGGELRCGRPWHEYGVEFALGSCDEEKNPFNRLLEVPLGGQAPDYVVDYDPVGWPTFTSWPYNRTLTHEQFYWRWLERAYAGGLRLMTNLLVDNTALCQQFPVKRNSCNEMDSVRLQAQRLFELQDYVDAQSGGPGEGWFRIVTTPSQARQVVNGGRMAVVLGIEVSALFDCSEFLDQPQCTAAQIDERLQEVFDMGVRQMELVNKFDNALTGVKGDPGATGVVVNSGNKYVTGHWWDMRTCTEEEQAESHDHGHGRSLEGDEHDHTQLSPADATPEGGEGVDALAGRVLDQFGPVVRAVAPLYGPGPHCNSRGLTALGEHLVKAMVEKGMVFDPDHMSAKAQRQALDLLEHEIAPALQAAAGKGRPARKPSVISSHSWANDVAYQRIYALDGVVAPYAGEPTSFVQKWVQHRGWSDRLSSPTYDFGMGYGADTNGLGGQPPARKDPQRSLQYTPEGFAAPIGGVRLTQQRSGLRTFDVTTEGVSMYGLFADWFQEVALAADELAPQLGGGQQITEDMLDGAETYLRMWERAVYGGGDCVEDRSTLQLEDVHAALGLDLEGFLRAIGQPADRDGAAYVYCVEGEDGAVQPVEVVFDEAGTAAELVEDTAGTPAVQAALGGAGSASATTAVAAAPAPAATARAAAAHDHLADDHAGLDHAHDDVAAPAAADGAPAAQDGVLASLGTPAGAGIGLLVLVSVALLGVHAAVDRRRAQEG